MNNNELLGLHHVTAMTSSAEKIYQFFTETLGLKLAKKTVNQDDIQTYHLFFTDDVGTPGMDMTFFDFPNIQKGTKGTNTIAKTGFRVPSDAALDYWLARFEEFNVKHGEIKLQFGKKYLNFEDFDEQQYQLVSDELNVGMAAGIPFKNSPVPAEFAIVGLGPVTINIDKLDLLPLVLNEIFQFKKIAQEDDDYLYEVGEGGNGAQVIIAHRPDMPWAYEGYGNVHHVAFRVKDRAVLEEWIERTSSFNLPNSGHIDRFYFESLYVRVAPHILFEIATDGPGFMQDESYETMGESLSLPPFLEKNRSKIEAAIRPFDTRRKH